MCVLIHITLHRSRSLALRWDVGARGPAIADLHYVMESQGGGRDAPENGHAHVMDGKGSSLVFEVEEERASRGGLEPGAMGIPRVVVADRVVIPASLYFHIFVLRELQRHPSNIHPPFVQ